MLSECQFVLRGLNTMNIMFYPFVISECQVLFKHEGDSDITCGLSLPYQGQGGAIPANTVFKGTVAQDAL
jgi:hypothetical protein